MTVLCPGCNRRIRIPPEKQDVPNLRAKCGGCGAVFLVCEASLALTEAAALAITSAAPAPENARPPAAARPAGSPTTGARPAPPEPRPPAPAAKTAGGARPRAGAAWRQCANHPRLAAASVCSRCEKGWCPECAQKQGPASICPSCDALCRSSAEQQEREALARRRARPLRAELGEVLAYPFSDTLGYVMLSVFVGVFSLLSAMALTGGGLGRVVSQGLVFAYAFSAINRVSAGKKQSFMPEISDMTDLIEPVRHGVAAMLISSGPLLLLLFLFPAAAFWSSRSTGPVPHAAVGQAPAPTARMLLPDVAGAGGASEAGVSEHRESSEPVMPTAPLGPTLGLLAALGLALLWKLAYSPVALIAAAISHSFFATLNPVVGVGAIRRMGPVYWEAMVVYTILSVAETVLSAGFGMIPVAGHILRAFVQCYAYLAIGCLLGLAVFKRAPELGLD